MTKKEWFPGADIKSKDGSEYTVTLRLTRKQFAALELAIEESSATQAKTNETEYPIGEVYAFLTNAQARIK